MKEWRDIACALLCGACASHGDGEESGRAHTQNNRDAAQRPTLEATSMFLQSTADGFIDQRGHRWVSQGRALFASPSELATLKATRTNARPIAGLPTRASEAEMSLDELATLLRARTVVGGIEYEMAEPDYEGARAVQAKIRQQRNRHSAFDGYQGPTQVAHSLGAESSAATIQPRAVIDSDNREKRRDNTAYPHRTQVVLPLGSATLIDRAVAYSAAHVFRHNGKWLDYSWYAPAADKQDSNDYTYKPGAQYPSSVAKRVEGCMVPVIPADYDNGEPWELDWAIVEFLCGHQPGVAVGWLGTMVASDADLSGLHFAYGYPQSGCTSNGQPSSCNWPQIWGIGNSTLGVINDLFWSRIDATEGQSGMGFYKKSDWGDRFVFGTLSGQTTHSTEGPVNFGRRWSWGVRAFFEANSNFNENPNSTVDESLTLPNQGNGHD